mmetsp:Transcript_109/g.350  ORF Transcript_109/g.350 Transcript_109/m.350 type:complete len:206 (-) Transcript_109:526-1143(-)
MLQTVAIRSTQQIKRCTIETGSFQSAGSTERPEDVLAPLRNPLINVPRTVVKLCTSVPMLWVCPDSARSTGANSLASTVGSSVDCFPLTLPRRSPYSGTNSSLMNMERTKLTTCTTMEEMMIRSAADLSPPKLALPVLSAPRSPAARMPAPATASRAGSSSFSSRPLSCTASSRRLAVSSIIALCCGTTPTWMLVMSLMLLVHCL